MNSVIIEEVTPFASGREEMLDGLSYVDLRVRWAVARAHTHGLDPNDDFRGLHISAAQVDDLLGYELGDSLWPEQNGEGAKTDAWPAAIAQARDRWQARIEASRAAGHSLPLDQMAHCFGLDTAEVDAFLIALAPELDPRYERLFAYLQDNVTRKRPSVDLILNLLTTSFAEKLDLRPLFTDNGRLIQSRLLLRFADPSDRQPTLLSHYVQPAPNVVEHLLGHPAFDEALSACAQLQFPAEINPTPGLPATLVERLKAAISDDAPPPFFAFYGSEGLGKRNAAMEVANFLNRPLLSLNLERLAEGDTSLMEGLRLALRDGRLTGAALYLTEWDSILSDDQPPLALFHLLLAYPNPVIVAGEDEWYPSGCGRRRPVLRVAFTAPDYETRLRLWEHHVQKVDVSASGKVSKNGNSERVSPLVALANQFQFTPGQIEDAAATANDLARWRGERLHPRDLFAASRSHSNQKLSTLATKIKPRYGWEDIVLPADTLDQLHEMVNTIRKRPTVYGRWGFGRKLALGKGLSALFAGESGTGKTMAADIMAGELSQELYKIDLSMLVSKYIGETEKNLNRIFNEAATSNAILFFDEADAIFGKRSEVKDSHDRYANIEISYLLQRMEAYDGTVILATNLRGNLDEAFTRRLHFIVHFPFPDAASRERIWQVNVPPETPLAEDVDFTLLAQRFKLAGGNIRNIIMAAAFLAAAEDQVVSMHHLLRAARREYQKIGKLIDESTFTWEETT